MDSRTGVDADRFTVGSINYNPAKLTVQLAPLQKIMRVDNLLTKLVAIATVFIVTTSHAATIHAVASKFRSTTTKNAAVMFHKTIV